MVIGIFILGCDKNTVDAEYLAGILAEKGCEVIAEPPLTMPLDAAVVVTCGFIADAKVESIDKILELAQAKETLGNPKRLYIMGCLSQRYANDLSTEVPQIDGIVGVGQMKQLAAMILAEKTHHTLVRPVPRTSFRGALPRQRLDTRPYAFLKIADGCNHACTFCSIPIMKGAYQSIPPHTLLREAQQLLAQGVRELNLVAQDIAGYGIDQWKSYRLPHLLKDLCSLSGTFWIRLLYCYPHGITDPLLEVMATEPKIVPYLDIPFQHFDPEVLERMGRPFGKLNPEEVVSKVRSAMPGIVLRTTMLVGFPGESPRAHRNMLQAMERLRFERLGAFIYSPEEGTPAANFPKQVRRVTRQRRWDTVMSLQAEISAAFCASRVGSRTQVLVEDFDKDLQMYVTRSAAEAPEVDGLVYVTSEKPLALGEFIDVQITNADVYDIYAVPSEKSERQKP
ncbi:MAG TPA: 30S ribosomal protein S12 methylthiotransferase RimO [Candidatus Hydrogenedentes bacterium]|nr:30S ribosomal protein S12 methylthiotransferase RimO [Candidatus Hydrogenedentota bacterium]HOL76850.1 30S ribosomal protein S12 methylthiotransferase RimO [Candidatus Hydrogenedentota bacterium]HPO86208.1 30S ribosomal protein S12 methylthiotransferase RimO [Candidatus Hydrogenedentota bacterium]